MATKCSSCSGSGQRIETYTDVAEAQDDPNFGFPRARVKTKTRFVKCEHCGGSGSMK